ncbi:hypothetical protein HGRIS_013612 [Hohenbuehelia grisea]|uniref:Uncharacterized protein n=1 Tax=Hohenbuehelia grisea TaxID=104357 RepID=A0ABR3IW46_9AGAR
MPFFKGAKNFKLSGTINHNITTGDQYNINGNQVTAEEFHARQPQGQSQGPRGNRRGNSSFSATGSGASSSTTFTNRSVNGVQEYFIGGQRVSSEEYHRRLNRNMREFQRPWMRPGARGHGSMVSNYFSVPGISFSNNMVNNFSNQATNQGVSFSNQPPPYDSAPPMPPQTAPPTNQTPSTEGLHTPASDGPPAYTETEFAQPPDTGSTNDRDSSSSSDSDSESSVSDDLEDLQGTGPQRTRTRTQTNTNPSESGQSSSGSTSDSQSYRGASNFTISNATFNNVRGNSTTIVHNVDHRG